MRLFELSGPSGGTGDGGEGETYEDLCRSHIDAMIAAAAAREVTRRDIEALATIGIWVLRITRRQDDGLHLSTSLSASYAFTYASHSLATHA